MTLTSSFTAREGVGSRSLAAVVVVVGAALVAACQTSTTATDVTAAPDAPKCQVTLGTPGAVAATGGSGKFSVTTQPECSWTASSAVNWISSVSPGSGQGTLDVEFRVAPNEGSSTREGDIVVNESRVRVSQSAPCRYSVSPANQGMSASAGTGSVSVTITSGSDCSWSASSDSGWLTLTGSTSGRSNATVSFSVPANGNTERTGSIIVAGQRATVTQAAQGSPAPGPGPGPGPTPGCTYTIAPTSATVAALGGTGSTAVTTQSGCQWSASSNASWITVTSGGSGTGNGSVGFSVGVNLGAGRNGTITIAGQSFTVNQTAALPQTCTYSVSPTNVKMGKGGDSKSVKVTTSSGCAWTASSNTSWISVDPGSGTGTGNVTITAAKNTGGKRTGSATVAGQTVTVEQDGA
jgi:Putative binding domain, N-terminal/Viral BACON domain